MAHKIKLLLFLNYFLPGKDLVARLRPIVYLRLRIVVIKKVCIRYQKKIKDP